MKALPASNVLFGGSSSKSLWSSTSQKSTSSSLDPLHTSWDDKDDDQRSIEAQDREGVIGFFLGFMFEDKLLDHGVMDDEMLRISHQNQTKPVPLWNSLNTPLFVAYSLTAAATSVPVTLLPAMSDTLQSANSASFAPRLTASAVLGTSCGKFLLSFMGDLFGARRTAVTCSLLLSLSLVGLSLCHTADAAFKACFCVEFFQSVQWPCIIVLLATHYRSHGSKAYEGGIFVTSLASRFGVLMGIPLSSLLLRSASNWRWVALAGAWAASIASSILFLFIHDSPTQQNDPQNPIDPQLLAHYKRKEPTLVNLLSLLWAVFCQNIAPSVKHVLQSPAFYIVALAHTGSSAVRTSERILGTYYRDTSLGTLSENRAGGLAVFLSLGTILGLMVAGHWYSKGTERERKRLVTRLYIANIMACYTLAFLAIPWLRMTVNAPSLILIFQVMATSVMGFSIAVQLYHIPSLVGATFGCDKGMYAGCTDGLAYGLSSLLWRVVGNSVGDASGAGWAYGWMAVALILIVSAILMTEFMEHYFVRPGARTAGGYETIMFA